MAGLVESGSFGYSLVKDARQIIRYPDLAEPVRDGSMKFDEALKEARQRTQTAASAEADGTTDMSRLSPPTSAHDVFLLRPADAISLRR